MRISRQVHVVSLEGARAIISAGRTEAARRGWAVAIAVVEPSGDLIAFEMMDGTQPASQAIAVAKARTAARLRRSTKQLEDTVAVTEAGSVMFGDRGRGWNRGERS